MSNPISWFEIYVQDMARAKRFYEAVLQVTFKPLSAPGAEMEMWSFPGDMDSYGASGALVHLPSCPSGGNATLVYFECKDCAVEEARVVGAGGRIHRAKMSIGPYGHISLVYDTEDNLVGLHSIH